MAKLLRIIVQDYGWIHLSIGLFGNLIFFTGSILFLPPFEAWKTQGVWLFIGGSALMFVGALGRLLVDLFSDDDGNSG